MADIIPFNKPKPSQKHKGNTLCRNNHHKWKVIKESQFDVIQGRLVTLFECARCGATKSKLL